MKAFNRMNFVADGLNARVQPVFANDVGTAVLNCLKMDETIGETYDLGGPHVYNYLELYEMMANICLIKPYTSVHPLEDMFSVMHKPTGTSFWRYYFKTYARPEFIIQDGIDLVCREDAKGFDDLHIKPISFA